MGWDGMGERARRVGLVFEFLGLEKASSGSAGKFRCELAVGHQGLRTQR